MTQEEKQLLLIDLCARLPYGVVVLKTCKEGSKTMESISLIETDDIDMLLGTVEDMEKAHYTIKPYLRPMSSMTDDEENEYNNLNCYAPDAFPRYEEALDYLNEKHFDYRGLIGKGLAIAVTEENNPYK